MTRHIKANRRFKIHYEVLAYVEKHIIVMAPDEAEAEVMFSRLEDSGTLAEPHRKEFDGVEISFGSRKDDRDRDFNEMMESMESLEKE